MNVTTATHASANITQLNSTSASITTLTATSASVTNLTATSLVLSNLSIASANVTTLTSASATITNLLATSLTVSSGSTLNGGVVVNETGADVDFRIESDTNANAFFVQGSDGNVGIGTSSPAVSGLEISRFTGSGTPTPVELRLSTTSSASDWSTTDPWGRLSFYSADTSASGPKIVASIDVVSNATSGGNANLVFNYTALSTSTLTEGMRITPTGLVGIGTSSPTELLQINAAQPSDAGFKISSSGDGWVFKTAYVANNDIGLTISSENAGSSPVERLRIDSSGNVGIGTNAPIDNLDVYGGVTLSTNDSFAVTGSDSTTTQVVFHGFRGGDGVKTGTAIRIRSVGDGAGNARKAIFDTLDTERFNISDTEAVFNDPGADVDFRIESDTDTHAFFLDATNGNIGIGTSSPATLLDVAGTVTADGLTVDGAATISGTGPNLTFNETDTTDRNTYLNNGGGSFNIQTVNDAGDSFTKRFSVNNLLGDISFYEDTGTTAGVFWDASASALGIGTDSPDTLLHLSSTSYPVIRLERNDTGIVSPNPYGSIEFEGQDESPDAGGVRGSISGIAEGLAGAMGLVFSTSVNNGTNTERVRITGSGDVGIGTDSPDTLLHLSSATGGAVIRLERDDTTITTGDVYGSIEFEGQDASPGASGVRGSISGISEGGTGPMALVFSTADSGGTNTERARITREGDFLVGKTTIGRVNVGFEAAQSGITQITVDGSTPMNINRLTDDGQLIGFYQANSQEGSISVSGSTVSYNAFAGSHWSQLEDGSKPDILRGTVMESINELCVWPDETNERLPKCKISDTAGSKKVYGVFMAWDNDWETTNDMYVTAVGAFICRVNASVTVQEGDLLESNGDGTARVQADDIIRSSTIGKVTSTVKTHQYDDGSYCVPAVLYCG